MDKQTASFNIIDCPWIYVIRKNGSKDRISLRTALKESRDIRDIIPPVYHQIACSIYMPQLYKFLSVFYMAANNIQLRSDNDNTSYIDDYWSDESLLNEDVKEYINKYYDRFDLFSEDHPFLQNKRVSESPKYNPEKETRDFISVLNPTCPSKSAELFGIKRSYGKPGTKAKNYEEAWRPDPEEFVYELLYNSSDAFSVMYAQYTASIAPRSSIYPILTGNDLHETILLNCVSLAKSARPNRFNKKIIKDAPVWEHDTSPKVFELYTPENIKDQVLFNAFFPAKPLLASQFLNDEGKIRTVCIPTVVNQKTKINTEELYGYTRKELSDLQNAYIAPNPWSLKSFKTVKAKAKKGDKKQETEEQEVEEQEVEEKKTEKKKELCYKDYLPELDSAWGLCIAATNKIEEYNVASIFDGKDDKEFHTRIYYRIPGGSYKNIIYGFGEIQIQGTINVLLNKEAHKKAEEYQKIYANARGVLNKAMAVAKFYANERKTVRGQFAAFVEDYFFTKFIPMLEENDQDAIEKATEVFRDTVLSIYKESVRLKVDNWERNAIGENEIRKGLFKKKKTKKKTESTSESNNEKQEENNGTEEQAESVA